MAYQLPDHLTPEIWLSQVLSSREAQGGGIVKRQVRDVERLVGRDAFLEEAERRGFQVVQNNRHFVIFCNALPIRRVRADCGLSKARP
ncbi:hypothetical protein [Jannaschia sp. CCS1]|uniref:hypothetical protein n=1 Tax=Jannaschia sp. (strain CCS1) TaxID=290400 RepID=UPI000053C4B3|nr:hypothetical protein [Jannaschia sp. CCS1]ABD56505.1 hypothetical protein Jann_3588 [Jannaschia sp. CCS1]